MHLPATRGRLRVYLGVAPGAGQALIRRNRRAYHHHPAKLSPLAEWQIPRPFGTKIFIS
jgi:hypothetical protein